MRECRNCIHSKVCGLYNALWDAIIAICDYDQTHTELSDRLINTLAENCTQFLREE